MRRLMSVLLLSPALLLTSCSRFTTMRWAAYDSEPAPSSATDRYNAAGGGGRERVMALAVSGQQITPLPNQSEQGDPGRKIVRSGSLAIVSDDPQETVRRVTELAQQLGGYVEKASVSGSERRAQSAEMVLRIPEAKLDPAREQIKKLAKHVNQDAVEATDVTRQFVDMDARLRSLKAQEEQYLVLMKRATAVKDMTEIQEKLGELRTEIDSLQGEFEYLKKQIQLSSLSLRIEPAAEAQVAGFYWHPWASIKRSFRSMLEGLADFADNIIALVLYLPVIALWLVVLVFGAKVLFRVVKWLWRRFLPAGFTLWRRKVESP
jgi:hypothetical protein